MTPAQARFKVALLREHNIPTPLLISERNKLRQDRADRANAMLRKRDLQKKKARRFRNFRRGRR